MCSPDPPAPPRRQKQMLPPTPADPGVTSAQQDEARRLALMRGRAGTIKTQGQNARPTLLGAPMVLGAGQPALGY